MNTGPARDFGIPFDGGDTGTNNAITDVTGVWIGHKTLNNPPSVFSGVTALLPRGNSVADNGSGIDTLVFAAWSNLNGNGEMTGTTWIEESGILEGPIMLTNTVSVGVVRNQVINYSRKQLGPDVDPDDFELYLPVVAETYDGCLNDILGPFPLPGTFPNPGVVAPEDVEDAINTASPDNQDQGNVGGGTGMTCYDWKGGIGTSSRVAIPYTGASTYTVGVLVQANQGLYPDLVIRGVPVGKKMTPPDSCDEIRKRRKSSIIVVIATDAPLLPHQLKRLTRRAALGVGRTGTYTNNDSGEIFIAFSNANQKAVQAGSITDLQMLPNDDSMDTFFQATVDATEEAIINALIAATTLYGRTDNKGHQRIAWGITDPKLPSSTRRLADVMEEYHRWNGPSGSSQVGGARAPRSPRPGGRSGSKRSRP
jgi:D-aminopeptidase